MLVALDNGDWINPTLIEEMRYIFVKDGEHKVIIRLPGTFVDAYFDSEEAARSWMSAFASEVNKKQCPPPPDE
jgi:hypothetical protein